MLEIESSAQELIKVGRGCALAGDDIMREQMSIATNQLHVACHLLADAVDSIAHAPRSMIVRYSSIAP